MESKWYNEFNRLTELIDKHQHRGNVGSCVLSKWRELRYDAYRQFSLFDWIPSLYSDEENTRLLKFASDNKILIKLPCVKHCQNFFKDFLNKIEKGLDE